MDTEPDANANLGGVNDNAVQANNILNNVNNMMAVDENEDR